MVRARVGPRIGEIVATIAVAGLEVQQSIPPNLRSGGLTRIGPLAELSRETGLAVAWVIPAELIDTVLDSAEPISSIATHRDWIIEHCDELLSRHPSDATVAASHILDALRADCWPAAQSHAANLIDSLILPSYPKRSDIVIEANRPLTEDEELRAYMRQFALLPMVRAYRPWHAGDAPLDGFSRHATAHAVHQTWAVTPDNALVAATVAVSLALEQRRRILIPTTGITAKALTSRARHARSVTDGATSI